jgi:hypothetical protein
VELEDDVVDLQEEEVLEVVEEQEEEPQVEQQEEDEPEVVERAKKYGHLSKEEWIAQGRDPKDWKSPGEFDKTGKVIEQLYSLRKKVDQRDREIQALIDYQQRTSQREYERAKKDLESRLAASKDDMDMEGVAHYTKELIQLENTEQQSKVDRWQQDRQIAQQAFIERNQHWFNDRNSDLMNRAIEIDNELKSIYPNATFDELAQKIEKRMQYEFPERVMGDVRAKPPVSVKGSAVNKTAVNKSSVSRTFQSLPQELKDTYNATKRIVESRGDREYTVSDFIEQLKKDGEL